MGCVYSSSNRTFFRRSKSKPNQLIGSQQRPNRVFSVINVDGQGNEINYGQIEVTDSELILHQRAKTSICWPLRSLRRYGFDSELFSFECGRRCPTGPGIYAFKCGQAEQLFNVLQESVQRCSNASLPPNFLQNLPPGHITSPTHNNVSGLVSIASTPSASGTLPHYPHHPPSSIGGVSIGQPSSRGGVPGGAGCSSASAAGVGGGPRLSGGSTSSATGGPHTYANDVHEYMNAPRCLNTLKRSSLSSITDELSLPPSAAAHHYHQQPHLVAQSGPPVRLSGHVEFMSGTTDINTNYAKLDDLVRYYVNINTPCLQNQQSQECSSSATASNCRNTNNHGVAPEVSSNTTTTTNAANNQSSDSQPNSPDSTTKGSPTFVEFGQSSSEAKSPRRPPPLPTEEPINYIMLDLDQGPCSSPTYVTTAPVTPVSKTPKNGELNFVSGGELPSGSSQWNTPPSTPPCSSSSSTFPPHSAVVEAPQQYATIDFDKTVALSNSVANHRKQ